MRVAIIIVNYRTAGLTVDCLRSLEADGYAPKRGRVIVVDNASGDDSCEVIGQAIAANGWSAWAELVPAERNGGFAYGNNVGIAQCGGGERVSARGGDDEVVSEKTRGREGESGRIPPSRPPALSPASLPSLPDYVLLLNPDTVVRPGAIKALVRFMEEHPKVGIAGSRLEDPDGTPQRSAFRFPTLWSELDGALGLGIVSRMLGRYVVAPPARREPHLTGWVAGASLIIRCQVLEQIGLLDERYFMYYEEVDFCLRAKRAGWECWYVPESRVVHLVGRASGINSADQKPKRRPAYWFESRRRYFQKNHGRAYAIVVDVVWLMGNLSWKFRRVLQGKPNTSPERFWRDMFTHSSLCRSLSR